MTYDLLHRPTQISRTFSKQFWAKALELAESYGWEPMGTCPPPDLDLDELNAEWHGGYLTNDGQIVKRVNAFWLADAIEKALVDIPDTRAINWASKSWLENELPEWLSPEEQEMKVQVGRAVRSRPPV
jgi:hypothetical protein